ncbi:hypothetical protein KSS87_022240 [Heliosperma pusillum]|nr:hypothetical protein KSS87_022240 [Heliosperma pusillum]
MQNIAIISSFKSMIYPKDTNIFRMSMRRESRFTTQTTVTICARNNQNISIKKGENINIRPKLHQSSANDETLITAQELEKDSKGLMSFFEAYHIRVRGDDILDDIGEFSGHLLRKMMNIEQSKSTIIKNTLSNPYHKSLPRFMAFDFLENFEISIKLLHDLSDENNWIKEIQYLAAIDINMAQINHQREITQVSRWWKGLRLTEELKLARSQPAKWHMWSLACLPAPDMTEQRVELTKAISFVYIIDDIFDVYGTLDELILFTEAVNRWEYDNVTGLPNYMRVCLKNLYELINEISEKAYKNHGWNPKEFLQKVWKDLFNAFLVDAKWFVSGHTPSADEYLRNGIVSIGAGIVCAYLFLLLGEGGDKGGKGHLNNHIQILSLAATICRLWNDLGVAKDENQNGHDWSYVACYMKEHKGSSTESAQEHVYTMISDAWKSLNETCQSSSPISAYFKEAVLNSARMIPVMYTYDESRRLSSLEKHMKSLIISEQTTVVS